MDYRREAELIERASRLERDVFALQVEVGRQATEAARWHATAEDLSSENAKLRAILTAVSESGAAAFSWASRAERLLADVIPLAGMANLTPESQAKLERAKCVLGNLE